MNINIECDCGDQLHITNDHDYVRCDNCGALFGITVTRLTTPTDPGFTEIPQPEFQTSTEAAVDELRNELDDVLGIVLYW